MYDYQARTERVVDGDTIIVLIDHGMNIRSSQSLRLLRVYAPELHATDHAPGAIAKTVMQDWISAHAPDGWGLRVTTQKDTRTFNRYLAEVTCAECGESLNDHMRTAGYTGQGTGAPIPPVSNS